MDPKSNSAGIAAAASRDQGPSTTAPGQGSDTSASQLHGHVQYLKGKAEEVIGAALNAPSWTEAGKHDVEDSVKEMRTAANQARAEGHGPEGSSEGVISAVERTAGRVGGCPGLREMGGERDIKRD